MGDNLDDEWQGKDLHQEYNPNYSDEDDASASLVGSDVYSDENDDNDDDSSNHVKKVDDSKINSNTDKSKNEKKRKKLEIVHELKRKKKLKAKVDQENSASLSIESSSSSNVMTVNEMMTELQKQRPKNIDKSCYQNLVELASNNCFYPDFAKPSQHQRLAKKKPNFCPFVRGIAAGMPSYKEVLKGTFFRSTFMIESDSNETLYINSKRSR